MSMIVIWIKKSLIVAMVAAMGLSALPFVNAYAQSANPPVTPAPGQPSADKLQKLWARDQTVYARVGKILDGANSLISKIQTKLDDAKSKGKDVSSVQTALDAFSAAVKNVQPTYCGHANDHPISFRLRRLRQCNRSDPGPSNRPGF